MFFGINKMNMPWKKSLHFLSLAVFIYLILCIPTGIWIKKKGSYWIENKISNSLSLPVSVKKADTNFLNSITLSEVKIQGANNFESPRIKISLVPWRFLFSPQLSSFVLIEILEPACGFDFSKSSMMTGSTTSLGIPSITIPFTALLKNGQLTLKKDSETRFFKQFHVAFHNTYSKKNLKIITGNSPKTLFRGNMTLTNVGNSGSQINGNWTNLNVDMARFWFPHQQQINKFGGTFDGSFDAIEVKNLSELFKTDRWNIEIKDRELEWIPAPDRQKYPLDVKLKLSWPQISGHLRVGKDVQVKGQISHPFEVIELDLQASSKELSLSELNSLLGIPIYSQPFDGGLSFDFQAYGSTSIPSINGSFVFNPTKGFIKLPKLKGEITVQDREVLIGADFSKGRIQLWRSLSKKDAETNYQVTLRNLSLAEIASLNGWANVGGYLKSEMNIGFNQQHAIGLKGNFQLDQLTWGRTSKQPLIAGKVVYRNGKLSIQTNKDLLRISAHFKDEKAKLNEFQLRLGQESRISAQGTIEPKEGNYRLSVRGESIPPDMWPPLVRQYPDISGHLDFEGVLTGTNKIPHARLDIVFNRLKFIPNDSIWNGETHLLLDGESFGFKKVHVDGGYSGDITRKKQNGTSKWNIHMDL
ncbi:hypothetical protein BVX98_00640, partial [bacterium F11]